MSDEHSHNRLYLTVWVVLLVVTVVEVVLAYVNLSIMLMLSTLVILSFFKAGLIVAYFMHLRFEKFSLFVTLIPMLLICVVLMFGFPLPDAPRVLELKP